MRCGAGGVVQSNPYAVLDGAIEAVHDVTVGRRDEDEDWRPFEGREGTDGADMATEDSFAGVMRLDLCVHRVQYCLK